MEGLSIGGRASDAIRLNWKALSGVNGYKIEKYAGSSWTTVADVTNPSTTTYRIENLTPGTEYRFRVSSYTKAEDNGTVLVSDYGTTTEIKAKTSPAIVKNVKIGGTAQDALRINWSKMIRHLVILLSSTRTEAGAELHVWREMQPLHIV